MDATVPGGSIASGAVPSLTEPLFLFATNPAHSFFSFVFLLTLFHGWEIAPRTIVKQWKKRET
jgi:hypothetical protein